MKKWIAALLCAVMLTGLCACGETRIEPLEAETEKTTETASQTETETAAEQTEEPEAAAGLDWNAAYARHDPSDVVFTVDGQPVTWQELFYELANVTAGLQSAAGGQIMSWDAKLRDSAGNEARCGDYVLSYALTVLTQYHCVYNHLTAEGVTLGDEGMANVQNVKQTMIDNYFGGDEQKFLDNLAALFCSEELYDWFNMVDELYAEGFGALYGTDGAGLTDEEVLAYGRDNDYVQIRQIYLYPAGEKTESEETAETTESESAETVVDLSVLEPLAGQLGAASDNAAREKVFDGLYEKYNENAALDVYGPSRAISADDVSIGSVDQSVYDAARALEDYGYACVAAGNAAVLLMRVPLQADAPVYYETAMSKLCDLRYYAASQAYLEKINGEEGWIASVEFAWEPGFEGFNLTDAFAAETAGEETGEAAAGTAGEEVSDETSGEAAAEASDEPAA